MLLVPVFGLLANLVCMLFYLIGPFMVTGMSWKEPFIALGVCAAWGIRAGFDSIRNSKAKQKPILHTQQISTAA